MAKTKAEQIFEAAQTAYDACKKLKEIVNQSVRAQGVDPKVLRKKTEGIYLDPNTLSDRDAMVAAILLKKFENDMKASTKTSTKANQSLMTKPRMKI